MEPRHNTSQNGKALPDQWTSEIAKLLKENYEKSGNFEYRVFGEVYPNELYVAVCRFDPNNLEGIPVTYHISADLNEKIKAEKILDTVVDSIGHFFDQYFAPDNKEESFWMPDWSEASLKELDFFYRVDRENIELTLAADKLLKDS